MDQRYSGGNDQELLQSACSPSLIQTYEQRGLTPIAINFYVEICELLPFMTVIRRAVIMSHHTKMSKLIQGIKGDFDVPSFRFFIQIRT